jgi:hypothetical protein
VTFSRLVSLLRVPLIKSALLKVDPSSPMAPP